MVTKRKPLPHLPTGRPTKYSARFCDDLIAHMSAGLSYKSFAAKIANVHPDTLYEWEKRHPEFSEARQRGFAHMEEFYIRFLQGIAAGNGKRLESEEPRLDAMGQPVMGPDGNVLMTRTYAAARGNAQAAIFLAKNLLHWKDQRDIAHGGQECAPPIQVEHRVMTDEERAEREKELDRLAKSRKECGHD